MNVWVLVLKFTKKNIKWLITINICFSFAEQVEIRAIDNRYLHLTNVLKYLKNIRKGVFPPKAILSILIVPLFIPGVIVFEFSFSKL
jgi:hypothetical protein